MATPASPKSATPSCVKLFTCRPLSLGVGVNPLSLGSQSLKTENSITSLSAAPSCANFSTLPSAFLNTNNPSTLCWPLFPKPLDSQDRIYLPLLHHSTTNADVSFEALAKRGSFWSFRQRGEVG